MYKKKKTQGWLRKLFSTILGLAMVISLVNGVQMSADSGGGTPRELTDATYEIVDFSVGKFDSAKGKIVYHPIVENGRKTEYGETIEVGHAARIGYRFEIPTRVNQNDYFTIQLPNHEVFSIIKGVRPLWNDGEKIGTFEVMDKGKVRLRFDVDAESIHDGFLNMGGSFVKDSTSFEIPLKTAEASVTIPINKKPESNSDPLAPGRFVEAPKQPKLNKWGDYRAEGYFIYNLAINGEGKAKIFKANVSKTEEIDKKKNVILIDELPEGMSFHETNPPKKSGGGTEDPRDYFRVLVVFNLPAYRNGVITDSMTNTEAFTLDAKKKESSNP